MKSNFVMLLTLVLLTACNSLPKVSGSRTVASELTAEKALRTALDNARRGYASVSYLGVSSRGEVCELFVYESNTAYQWTQSGKIVADGIFNPIYGNPFMQSHAKIVANSVEADEKGVETRTVEVESGLDHSSAKLVFARDWKGFKGGSLNFKRGIDFNETCNFRAEIFNYSKRAQSVLNNTIRD